MSLLVQDFFHEPYFTDPDFSEIRDISLTSKQFLSESWCVSLLQVTRICVGILESVSVHWKFKQCNHSGGITVVSCCKMKITLWFTYHPAGIFWISTVTAIAQVLLNDLPLDLGPMILRSQTLDTLRGAQWKEPLTTFSACPSSASLQKKHAIC